VYMPPVDPRSFEHIGFVYVPEAASPGRSSSPPC
jgi:hypothetical protein